MKKTRILISLVVTICLVFSLSACTQGDKNTESVSETNTTEESSLKPDAELDATEIDGDKNEDIAPDDNYHDPAADDDENDNGDGNLISPGTHDGYYHEVGGAAFYTKHDINKWLKPNDRHPEFTDFDIGQMLYDIWCVEGGGGVGTVMENEVGFSYLNNSAGQSKSLTVGSVDKDNESLFHSITILHVCDGVDFTSSVRMIDCPKLPTGRYHIMSGYYRVIQPDLAPLILLIIERMEENPQQNNAIGDLGLNDNFVTY